MGLKDLKKKINRKVLFLTRCIIFIRKEEDAIMGSEGILCGFDIAIIYDILGARYCGNLIQSQILKPSFFLQSNGILRGLIILKRTKILRAIFVHFLCV